MLTQYRTKPEVEQLDSEPNLESVTAIYLELDAAIIAAIRHARSFCADDVAVELEGIFEEMRSQRKAL